MRVFLLSPSLSGHYCVVNVWSHEDEWEVVSRLSLSAAGVLYSNVNGDIRHGIHRGGVRGQCVYVFVCAHVCARMCVGWEFHKAITRLYGEGLCVNSRT